MSKGDLLGIYKCILRPSTEYSSIVYHSLIPGFLADRLESVQRQAMKVIFGYAVNYDNLLANGTIETLASRRQENCLKFALKVESSQRFNTWFKKTTTSSDREVRPGTRPKYIEKRCKTERSRNNPLLALTRILNEHYRNCLLYTSPSPRD